MLARRDLALEHVAPPPTLSRFTGRYGIVRGVASKLLWRQLFCRGPGCGAMFYICRSCYRGQVYCGDCANGSSRSRLCWIGGAWAKIAVRLGFRAWDLELVCILFLVPWNCPSR